MPTRPQTSPPPSDQRVWSAARRSRDPRFDGRFFVGVTTTGIYCRPVCPAPTAREGNVRYFSHAAAAAAAGFRPCLRCRPERAPGVAPCDSGDQVFDAAMRAIAAGALERQSLAALARRLGVTDRHLRRLFVARLGVAPHAVHEHQRLLLARQLLTETRLPITEVALASGYRSLRRFNDAFRAACAQTPSALRAGLRGQVGEGLRLRLGYRPPYDLAAVLGFLAPRCVEGVDRVEGASYLRVIGEASRPGWLRVSAWPGEHALCLELDAASVPRLPALIRRVRRLFDLDADPRQVHEVLAGDSRLSDALAAWPTLRVPGAFDGFELAARAVLGQQVSVAATRTLLGRLVAALGTPVDTAQGAGRLFPSPAAVAASDLAFLRIPQRRAEALRALAAAIADGRLDVESVPADVPRWCAEVEALPGIGPWTAHYIALRGLHHPDAFPAGDLVLRRALGAAPGASTRSVDALAEGWRPWRAHAVIALWQAASRTVERESA